MAGDYLHRLLRAVELGVIPPAAVSHVTIAHDGDCAALQGGVCICEPDITVQTPRGAFNVLADGTVEPLARA